MNLYEQSEATAARRRWMFVCVDDTDGKTPETSLTFSTGELQLSKNGGAFANAAGSATELSDGAYYYEATQAELDTVGVLGFKIEKTGVRTTIMQVGQVVPWDPYASALPANTTQWLGSAPNALVGGRVDSWTGHQITDGTAQAGGASTITLASGLSSVPNGTFNGAIVVVTGGTGAGQARVITDWVASTQVATVDSAWATNPDNTSTYQVLAPGITGAAIDTVLTASHGSGSWGNSPIASGTAQAGGATTITLASGASSTSDLYIDAVIRITGGTGAGQVNQITDYVGSSKVATVARAWATQPDSSSTYELLPAASPTAMADMTLEGRNIEGSNKLGDLIRGIVALVFGESDGWDAIRAAGGNGDAVYYAMDGTTPRVTVTYSTDGRTTITINSLAA